MNRFMQSQVNNALLSLETLNKSLEMSALKDDGVISKEEQRQIRKIRKAIGKFKHSMEKIKQQNEERLCRPEE